MANFGSAAALTASGANRATFRRAGYNSQPYYDFVAGGPTEYAGSAISNYIGAGAFGIFAVVDFITVTANFAAANWYQNDCLFEDNSGFVGLTIGQTAGLILGNYDGA